MINARGSVLLCLFAAAFVLLLASRNVPVVACGGEIDEGHRWRPWNFEHVAWDTKGEAVAH